ncbi:hypothetical protein RHGRI_001381 [Rhododendron griersonianum]|nr:hypothetical protein RHGRI_001381 [Rhododendron griersonianum]
MSVQETPITPALERISTDHIVGRIVCERSYSSSSPKFLFGVDEDSAVTNSWDPHASSHFTSPTSNWEVEPMNPPTDRVLVVMDHPPIRTFFHHHRSLTMSRYYVASVMESPHLSLLDSLLSSSLRPPFYRVEEKEASGFASYRDLRAKAKTQYCHWMDEVRRPRFLEGFDKDSYALQPLPEDPDWFKELTILRFDHSPSYFRASRPVNPDDDSQQSKELLAAFAFLDINVLEEHVPHTNFVWACETLKSSSKPFLTAHINYFLDHLPTIKMWLKQNTAAHGFNQDLHDYELMHYKLSKLHDRVLALEDYSFELPTTATRYL